MNTKKICLFLGLFIVIIGLTLYAASKPFLTPKVSSKTQAYTLEHGSIKAAAPSKSIVEPAAPALTKKPDLRLEGTFISKDGHIAYIRDMDFKTGHLYSIGDNVANAKLVDIKSGEAVLDVAGKRYSLYLESGPGDDPIQKLSNAVRRFKKDMLLNMLNADEGVKNSLEINPTTDNKGNFCGYAIDGIKPGSLASLSGLRNGDVVKQINGQKLTTQQNAIQTFRKARKLDDIKLEVMRDKKNVVLKYSLR